MVTALCETSSFGALLQYHRMRAGLTQRLLADFSALSVRAIRDLEHGRVKSPRQETVRLLADALRLDEDGREAFLQAARRAGADRTRRAGLLAPGIVHPPEPRIGHTYEYVTIRLSSLSPEPEDGAWEAALNDMARQSWRLLAVEQGVAFLERPLPTRSPADRLPV